MENRSIKVARQIAHNIEQSFFFLGFVSGFIFIDFLISRTRSKKDSSTLMRDLADASLKGIVHSAALASISSLRTARFSSKSHLLPTRTMGTEFASLTRRIWSWNVVVSWNEGLDVMLNTIKNPCPERIYESRIAL